ncbi:hypothetical protein Emed_001380 [Eimeria media]
MTPSRPSGTQAQDSPVEDPSSELAYSSNQQDPGLHRKGNSAVYQPLHKAWNSAFYRSFFALVVVSVALVYLVSQCIHHISSYRGLKVTTRSLAAGGFGGGFCPDWPEDEDAEDPPSGEQGHPPGALAPGQNPAHTALVGGAHGQPPQAAGWGRRRMPPKWRERVKHVLGMIHHLATTASSLIPSMTPEDAVVFCVKLSMLAAVELATYAYTPDEVQPVRAQAGRAFIDLMQTLLGMQSTRSAAIALHLESTIYHLWQFHEALAETPKATEQFKDYRATIMAWYRTGHFTLTQTAAQVAALRHEATQGLVPSARVQNVCKVLEAIFKTRKRQLLGSLTMRYWFVICHQRIHYLLLYTLDEYKEAHARRPPSSVTPSDEVYYAIVAAGGTVVPAESPEAKTDYQRSSHQPPTAPDAGTGLAQGFPPVPHHHHSGSPQVPPPPGFGPLPPPGLPSALPTVPPPLGFGPLHLPSHPSGPGQPTPPLQPQLPGPRHPAPAVQPLQQPLEPGGPPDWEAQGARPRTAAEARQRAVDAGWGRRQMPPLWEGRFSSLLHTMQTAAVACSQILPSLFPQQAVMIVKHLSMITALQLTALAYLPDRLQPGREAVGAAYRTLIQELLGNPATLQAATLMNEETTLQSLHQLLRIVSRAWPPTEVLPLHKYQTKMIVQQNTCSYTYQQVMHMLKEMLLVQQSPGALMPRADVLVRALPVMFQVLKYQLLCELALRHPLISSHKGIIGYSLFTQEELYETSHGRKPRLLKVLADLQQAIRQAGGSPVDVPQTSGASGPGQAQPSEIPHAAVRPIASPPPQQMPPQLHARFVRPPPGLAPPPGFQPQTHQAHTASAPRQLFPLSSPPQPSWPTPPRPRAPTPLGQPRPPHWAPPWPSSLLPGPQAPSQAPPVQHGGIGGSAHGHQHLGSPGDGEDGLGLRDLAERLSKLEFSEDEDDT